MTFLTIAPDQPFIKTFAKHLGTQELQNTTIYLPTRRACRLLEKELLQLSKNKALFLPKMIPLGEVVEDSIFFEGNISFLPTMSPFRRHLLLTTLIQKAFKSSFHKASKMAEELSTLQDLFEAENISFEKVEGFCPDHLASHWQETHTFLKLLQTAWPEILKSERALNPLEKTRKLIEAQIHLWETSPPQTPIIAAGSTGSIATTKLLLQAVSKLPNGQIILPGLDQDLTLESELLPTHPQYGMLEFLKSVNVSPHEVMNLTPEDLEKTFFLKNIFSTRPKKTGKALESLKLIEAPTPLLEAASISLLMREALEEKDKTVALITPDRALATRVKEHLKRWDVQVDDSAGTPLSLTQLGTLYLHSAELIKSESFPVTLLSLLKHPLTKMDLPLPLKKNFILVLEMQVLRGLQARESLEGITSHPLFTEESALQTWWDGFVKAFTPFKESMKGSHLESILNAHQKFVSYLRQNTHTEIALAEEEEISLFLNELLEASSALTHFSGRDYPELLKTFLTNRSLRTAHDVHPRVFIWGPLEARLQQADRVILGGLNEGIWPPPLQISAWLSPSLRRHLDLATEDRRIGLSAHDFYQFAAKEEVFLTRSKRSGTSPTIASRWISALKAQTKDLTPEKPYLMWAEKLLAPENYFEETAPRPCPPVTARPKTLPVTQVGLWMRNPYALYARCILNLKPLDPLGAELTAATFGTLVHKIFETYVEQKETPDPNLELLLSIGETYFKKLWAPRVRLFWQPRFERAASWLIDLETARNVQKSFAEVEGETALGDFTLTARADRFDLFTDQTLSLIDYKTGTLPSLKEIEAGLHPQIALEAYIALQRGFNLPSNSLQELSFWKIHPSGKGEEKILKTEPEELARNAAEGLKALIKLYENVDTPYTALVSGDTYAHLAREDAWVQNETTKEEIEKAS